MVRILDALRRHQGQRSPDHPNIAETLDAVAARAGQLSHDLNNLLLVVSMESEQIGTVAGAAPEITKSLEALQQVVREGREIADRLAAIADHDESELTRD